MTTGEIINRETDNIRKYHVDITELKNIINKLKNVLEGSIAHQTKQK